MNRTAVAASRLPIARATNDPNAIRASTSGEPGSDTLRGAGAGGTRGGEPQNPGGDGGIPEDEPEKKKGRLAGPHQALMGHSKANRDPKIEISPIEENREHPGDAAAN